MKAFTLLLVLTFFPVSIFAQVGSPKVDPQSKDTLQTEELSNELSQSESEETAEDDQSIEKDEKVPSETKSFTLDANDAVLEERSIMEPPAEIHSEVPETTIYYQGNNRRNDDIQTLGGKNGHNGGFGGVTFRATEFNRKDIIMAGFRGGWIINRAMAIGFEGHGIIPTAEYENIDPAYPLTSRSVGGYGGMFLEPIILSNKVVHITFPISGGAGWLGYIVDWEHNNNYYSNDLIDDDVFWYIEPGAALELNVARNFRINMGASYRFTEDLDLVSTTPAAFEAWNYFLTLKFGSF